ncbi:MAG: winged helix-turn-helix domain-containing protein [Synechococcus sp.]
MRQRLQSPLPDGGLWSGPKVAKVLSEMLGRQVWPQGGWDYLRRLGYYSPQRPRPNHLKGDKQEQTTLKKLPTLKAALE